MTRSTVARYLRTAAWALSLSATLAVALGAERSRGQPTPLPQAMEQELGGMGLETQCEPVSPVRHRCSFQLRSSLTQRTLPAHAQYDQTTDTVYVYVERLVVIPPADPQLASALQRMMELNWELLVGKFEWDPRTGEVRLSAVMSTESAFDRAAFRTLVRALDMLAPRYRPELMSLLRRAPQPKSAKSSPSSG